MLTIFLAGDSTVANCPLHEYPMAGWGQCFQEFFERDKVSVVNMAKGGASSNSFIEDGLLNDILNRIRPGDYVFIQFGHNDQKEYGSKTPERYRTMLTIYLDRVQAAGADPILVSPVHRRFFDQTGKLKNTLGEFPETVRELAQSRSIPFIDLSKQTQELYENYGEEKSKKLFTWLRPNEHVNYPEGVEDNTHFSIEGARLIGQLVCEELKKNQHPLGKYIKSIER